MGNEHIHFAVRDHDGSRIVLSYMFYYYRNNLNGTVNVYTFKGGGILSDVELA